MSGLNKTDETLAKGMGVLGLGLGVLGGLEIAGVVEGVVSKVAAVLGGAFLGGYVGRKAGESLA